MKPFVKHLPVKWLLHLLCCALYVAVVGSLVEFTDIPITTFGDALIALAHWGVIVAALFVVLLLVSLLGTGCYVVTYVLLCLLSSCLAFYRHTIHFSFNTMILDVVFQNDITVSADMLTLPLLAWMLGVTLLGGYLALYRKKYVIPIKSPITWIAIFLAVVGACVLFAPSGRFARPICARIPFNVFKVTHQYLQQKQEISTERPRQCTYAHAVPADSCIVVVVIGEALRPFNLSINGYYRQTTPNMQRCGVVSLDSVFSDYVYTNKSVPHLLSRATTEFPNRAYTERSFIDVYKAAGIPTASIFNQDAEKPYAYFIHEADTVIPCNQSKTVYNLTKWLDEDILPHYERIVERADRQLILVHTIGSHWWYNSHYRDDFEVFKPVMTSKNVFLCDSMQIVNSYDNTILYADYVWNQMIQCLRNKTAVFIYLSDHGEALGEEGVWLHATELPIMHHTAAFVWMSDKYKKHYPQHYNNVILHKNKRIKTDFLYHTVLQAGGIQTDVLDSTLSIF